MQSKGRVPPGSGRSWGDAIAPPGTKCWMKNTKSRKDSASSSAPDVAHDGNFAQAVGLADRAVADCNRQDRSCRVIALGPFAVEAKGDK